MKNIEKMMAIGMLVFAIGFNLWLYRLEPTATIDPNDNSFQFALVDRTNQIWDYAQQRCANEKLKLQTLNVSIPQKFIALFSNFKVCSLKFTLLLDHWVPNWAEGYNLPFYYSHVPQIVIVASWRLIPGLMGFMGQMSQMSLFQYYHWVIYLLLSIFPLSVFLALRVVRLPWLIAGLGAILASHISTDGLYGLDPPSFLWRGYGLSSQLFAMIWMPLGLAYSYRYFTQSTKIQAPSTKQIPSAKSQTFRKLEFRILKLFGIWNLEFGASYFWLAVVFLTMTAMGHLGLGMIAMLSLVPLGLAQPTKQTVIKFLILAGTVIFFLSYWIIPIFLADNYHNFSFWDPPWKFASYGMKTTIVRFLNGELFDWGRGPWMTVLVLVGLVGALWSKSSFPRKRESSTNFELDPRVKPEDDMIHFPFALLFIFWLLLYFGRTTWGGLIDLIPGMREFHLSRFIVGIHAAGLFLAPIGLWTIIERIRFPNNALRYLSILGILGIITPAIYQQTISYASHNDRLIKQANENHAKVKADEEALFAALGGLPRGRVFAGRGGWWGKDFKVAETPYYMNLSTYGIPTVLWLPETWSPNSDVEQYFSEDQAKDYDLFGIRYVAAPPDQKPQPFWRLIAERPTWKLYEVTSSYFTTGVRPAVVATDKRSYGNVVRLWIQSDAHVKGLYPELTFAKNYPRSTGLPNFKMLDEVTYVIPDGSRHNLFQEPPWYQNTTPAKRDLAPRDNNPILQMEENDSDMIFKTKVEVGENCTECIVVLKQSFHPNWRATIDGEPAPTFTVFPFFVATSIPVGTHEMVFSYEPNRLKVTLLIFEIITITALLIARLKQAFRTFRLMPIGANHGRAGTASAR